MQGFLSRLLDIKPRLSKEVIQLCPGTGRIVRRAPRGLATVVNVSGTHTVRVERRFLRLGRGQDLKTFLRGCKVGNRRVSGVSTCCNGGTLRVVGGGPCLLYDSNFTSFGLYSGVKDSLDITPSTCYQLSYTVHIILGIETNTGKRACLARRLLVRSDGRFFGRGTIVRYAFSGRLLATELRDLVGRNRVVCRRKQCCRPSHCRGRGSATSVLLHETKGPSPCISISSSLLSTYLRAIRRRVKVRLSTMRLRTMGATIDGSAVVVANNPKSNGAALLGAFVHAIRLLTGVLGVPGPSLSLTTPANVTSGHVTTSANERTEAVRGLFRVRRRSLIGHRSVGPLRASVIVLSRISVLSVSIVTRVLEDLGSSAVLVLLKSHSRLPSVKPNGILSSVVSSREIPIMELIRSCHRNSQGAVLAGTGGVGGNSRSLMAGHTSFILCGIPSGNASGSYGQLETMAREIFYRRCLSNNGSLFGVRILSPLHDGARTSISRLGVILRGVTGPRVSRRRRVGFNETVFHGNSGMVRSYGGCRGNIFGKSVNIVGLISTSGGVLLMSFRNGLIRCTNRRVSRLGRTFTAAIRGTRKRRCPVIVVIVAKFRSVVLLHGLFCANIAHTGRQLVIVNSRRTIGCTVHGAGKGGHLSTLYNELEGNI